MRRLLLPFGLAALGFNPVCAQNLETAPFYSKEATATPTQKQVEISGVLNLETAIALALKANPEISAAQHEVNALIGSITQAKTSPNPTVSALVEDTRRATRTTTVQVDQEIEVGGQRRARTEAAEVAYDAAAIELKAKRAEIRSGVMAAFFTTLAAQERLRLAQSFFDLAQNSTLAASKRVKAGKISPVEETKSRVAESIARLELNQAQNALITARQRLAILWGNTLPLFEKVNGNLDTSLPSFPDLSGLTVRLADSPLLQRAKLEIQRRQALAKVESRRRIPNVTVTLGTKRVEELGLNQAILGLSIPLPVHDTNQGNIQEALIRTEKAKDDFSALQLRMSSELTTAYGRFTTARQEIESLQRDILPGAQSAHAAATKGFELGKFNFLDVLDAQRTLFQSQVQYANALVEVHLASAEIHRLLGTDIADINLQPKEPTHE